MIRTFGRRFAMMLGGEALQSGFNFVLNVSLAGTLPARDYGFFAIVVLIGGFGMMYMRALIGMPACIFIPQSRRPAIARAYAVTFGSGALVLSVAGTLIVSAVLAVWQPETALAGGAFVGAWSMRGYIRMLLFAQRRATLATVSDLAFTVSATAFCVPLLLRPDADTLLQKVLLVLVAANAIGTLLGLLLLRQPVRVSFRRSVRRRFLTLLPTMRGSIVSVTMANLQGQGPALVLAAIAGPAAYAPIAATLAFFAPLRLATIALNNMIQPELATGLAKADSTGLRKLMMSSTVLVALICLLYGLMMAFIFPMLAARMFADRFPHAHLGLIAVEVWCIASIAVLYSVPKTLLETARSFGRITILSAAGALVGIPLMALILLATSPAWSLIGLLVSELLVFSGCWTMALMQLPAGTVSPNRPRRPQQTPIEITAIQNSGAPG